MSGVNPNIPQVRPGDAIKADDWNALAEGVNRSNAKPLSSGVSYMVANAAGMFVGQEEDNGVLFYNDSGSQVPAYGLMLLKNKQAIGGGVCPSTKQPDTYGCQYNVFVNGPSPVANASYGYAQRLGQEIIAAYDNSFGTPANGEMWGPGNGSFLLKKNYGGFLVVGTEDETNFYARVIHVPMLSFRGKPTGDVSAGSSGTVNIYTGAFGSETQPTGTPSMSSIQNDSSCTVKGGQICTVQIVPDNAGWQFVIGKTS